MPVRRQSCGSEQGPVTISLRPRKSGYCPRLCNVASLMCLPPVGGGRHSTRPYACSLHGWSFVRENPRTTTLQQWVHVTLTRRIVSGSQPGPGSPFAATFFAVAACLLLNGRYGVLSMAEKGRFLPIVNLTHDRLLLGEKRPLRIYMSCIQQEQSGSSPGRFVDR